MSRSCTVAISYGLQCSLHHTVNFETNGDGAGSGDAPRNFHKDNVSISTPKKSGSWAPPDSATCRTGQKPNVVSKLNWLDLVYHVVHGPIILASMSCDAAKISNNKYSFTELKLLNLFLQKFSSLQMYFFKNLILFIYVTIV